MDAGCGSGRLTAVLLERVPRGRVVAVDRSTNMLAEARSTLARFGDRVRYIASDLEHLRIDEPVDVVFSTATFHWLPDHDALFRSLHACLRPGGRLLAQCGGGANLEWIHARAQALLDEPMLRGRFVGWHGPWNFQDAESTAARLRRAGFVDVACDLELAPTVMPDRQTYKDFLRTVILRAHLAQIGDAQQEEQLLERMAELGARDETPFLLDYVRLNLRATRPR